MRRRRVCRAPVGALAYPQLRTVVVPAGSAFRRAGGAFFPSIEAEAVPCGLRRLTTLRSTRTASRTSGGERGRGGDDRRPRVPARYGVRAGPGRPLPLRAASPPAAAAGRLRPGLPVAGRAGRGRIRPLRRQPPLAEATDVRQGVGGLGRRAG